MTHTKRGQALVLFSLLMLTAMVMSLMTVSLAERAKERIELQSAADHAAFSNAVATAHAMNGSALLLRAQIAHYVAIAGVQSLVSFAGSYRGYLNAMENYYVEERKEQAKACNTGLACGCRGRNEIDGRVDLIRTERDRIKSFWADYDYQAGEQIYGASLVTLGLLGYERENTQQHLIDEQLVGSQLANEVVKSEGGRRRKWSAAPLDAINVREVGVGGQEGAIIGRNQGNLHGVWAVMGSRGNPFVTARNLSYLSIEQGLRRIIGVNDPVVFGHSGTSYFSELFHGNQARTVSGVAAWGDDHGTLGMQYTGNGCAAEPGVMQVSGVVKSTDGSDDTDTHVWSPNTNGLGSDTDLLPGFATHTASVCMAKVCPAMMFAWQDYNPALVALPEDVFGQPKNYVVAIDDRSERPPDPWNLMFRFQVSREGPGSRLEVRANGLSSALSAGIAYYHRREHWKEPPNLFNPFWRAGLVRADIDDQAKTDDLQRAVAAAADPAAADAFGKLYSVGYRGIQ